MSTQILVNPYPFGNEVNQRSQTVTGTIVLFGAVQVTSPPTTGDALNWLNMVTGNANNENFLGQGKGNAAALITGLSASLRTVTATAANNFTVGQVVRFVDLTTTLGLLLNGTSAIVVTASPTQFTFLSPATGSGSGETGIAVSGGNFFTLAVNPVPFSVKLWSLTGSGYVYQYVESSPAIATFEVGSGSEPLALVSGSYPACVLADVVAFEARFAKDI